MSPARSAELDASGERAMMAGSLSWLYLVAAALGPVTHLAPPYPGSTYAGILAVSGVALSFGIVLRAFRDRLPLWSFQFFAAAGSLLVGAAIYLTQGVPNAAVIVFVWITLYSFYFFSRPAALAQMALVGTVYAADIALRPPPIAAIPHWVTTVAGLAAAGWLVGVLRDRRDSTVARLTEVARTDALTGLRNRRGLEEALDLEIERARRGRRRLTLVVCDLDHFKLVNDRFGHPTGDATLRCFGEVLDSGRRRIDTAGRIGGEEFALILPDTDRHGGCVLAERLRCATARRFAGEELPLTVSFGVATYPEHGANIEALMGAADQALYAAKKLGRDRVVIYGADSTRELLGGDVPDGPQDGRVETMVALAEAVDRRDAGTVNHSAVVGRYAEITARELGLAGELVRRVALAGVLHDIGKVDVPDAILRKPGPLDETEWREMKRHPELGARLLSHAGLSDLAEWVLAHHERLDGSGYPRGLRGPEIPLEAKILAVADAYEAMIAARVYRSALSEPEAREELRRHAGSQFDARVVEAFLAALDTAGAVAGAAIELSSRRSGP